MAEQICNFDETKVDFNLAPWSAFSKTGYRLLYFQVNGHSGWCIVMLCFTTGANMCTVQPSGHMDGESFQEWAQDGVHPYGEVTQI